MWVGGGGEGSPGRCGSWLGQLRASKQASWQVWSGRAPRGSSLSRLPRREHEQEEGSRPQSAGCGLWPPPRPPPRAAARLRACGFAAASPMLERRPSVKKVSGRVRVGCFLLGGRWLLLYTGEVPENACSGSRAVEPADFGAAQQRTCRVVAHSGRLVDWSSACSEPSGAAAVKETR